jgi:serine/threonine protein kinase/tetratricopeptide (TPR) repeat protein
MTQTKPRSQFIGKRYLLHEELGKGGMGVVFRATDRLTGQIIALKRVIVSTENRELMAQGDSTDFRLALAREFKVLASLRHPHIVSVLDYGFDDERQPYITMELLEEAQSFLIAGQSSEIEQKLDLAIQLLQALAYLHRRGVLHRDLKPSNVLVTGDSRIKVVDFGLAEETEHAKEIMGTLAYMAPEILRGEAPTEAADLYAVGVMCYELLTGKHPFDTSAAAKLFADIIGKMPDLEMLYSLRFGDQPAPTSDAEQALTDLGIGEKTLILDSATGITPPDTQTQEFDAASLIPPDVNSLPGIVGKLLSKSPQYRYHDAYDVIADLCAAMQQPVPVESAAIRESFLQAATFVGRDQELGRLEAALAATIEGNGSAWLVGGESGVGKSRLLEELRTRALVQGVTVLRGQAVAEVGAPYESWREALRRLVLTTDMSDIEASILKDLIPDIEHLLDRVVSDPLPLEGSAQQQRLLGTIASLFQRQTEPILLLLEDLQWAGESLDVLRLLVGMVADLRLLIVGTYRTEDRPTLPDELAGMQLLRMERLDRPSIAALSASMLGDAGRQPQVLNLLERETEGNVFFLVEVVRALAEEAGRLDQVGRMSLPQHVFAGGVQTVVQRRLTHVPESGQTLLRLAAIAGRELDLNILEYVKDSVPLDDWLTTCANSAVLEVLEGNWRFAHDKLRSAALASIPDDVRPDLHRQIALAIESAYPDASEQATALAQHWRSAGDSAREFVYIRRAGEYALQISAFAEAIASLERALELLPAVTPPDSRRVEADILVKLGAARKYTGDYQAATTHLEAALQLWSAEGEQEGHAQALLELAELAYHQGDYPTGTRHSEESLTLFRALNNQQGMARALDRMGMIAIDQGDHAAAIRLCEEGLSLSRAANDPFGIASAINSLGMAAFSQGNYPVATGYFEESLSLSRASGEQRKSAVVLLNLGSAAGAQGDFPASTRYFEECLTICRRIGERRVIAIALDNLGFLAQLEGNYDRATTYFEESLAIAQAIGNRRGSANTLVNLGHVARAQNETGSARFFYREALELGREIEATPIILEAIAGIAEVSTAKSSAVTWLGLVLNHSAASEETRKLATTILDNLRANLSAGEVETLLERGKIISLEDAVAGILQEIK